MTHPRSSMVWRQATQGGAWGVLALWLCVAASPTAQTAPAPDSLTPRELYNAGTQRLLEKKWADAESLLHATVALNVDQVQPSALYNLGCLRFAQGKEELHKGPDARTTLQRGRTAAGLADAARQSVTQALATQQVEQMIAAYWRGRGVRRELKEATKAVQMAIESHEATLSRWQRAAGDFRSAVELSRSAADAAQNADLVDQYIARLVDSLREMQAMAQALGNQRAALEEALEGLRGQIPDIQGDPGPGEEGDDEEFPFGPEPGQEEARSRDGRERPISPEDAARILESFQLDRGRPLPMGLEKTGEPKSRTGRSW